MEYRLEMEKRAMDLMLCLNEVIEQLVMTVFVGMMLLLLACLINRHNVVFDE